MRLNTNPNPQTYPLSYSQQGIWLHQQQTPQSIAYHTGIALYILSAPNLEALHQSLQAIVDRHPALRTLAYTQDGQPVQQTVDGQAVAFTQLDASAWDEDRLRTEVLQAHRQPYDFAQGPLFRVHLFSQSPTRHVLLFGAHHLIMDAESWWQVLEDMQHLYPAYCEGLDPSLPPLVSQYTDYVQYEQDVLEQGGQKLEAYWQSRLADVPLQLDLPTDYRRPLVQQFQGRSEFFALSADLTAALNQLAIQEKISLRVLLLAAFQILLHRYAQQEKFVVGLPATVQAPNLSEAIVGNFINILPLAADFGETLTVKDLLRQVWRTMMMGLRHQAYPFLLLVQDLDIPHNPAISPIVQVLFNFPQPQPEFAPFLITVPGEAENEQPLAWAGLSIIPYGLPQQEGGFDLTLDITQGTEKCFGTLMYNTDLFATETIQRMVGHFQMLLEGMVANPDQQITHLPMLTPAEYHQIVHEWNDTKVDFGQPQTIHALFEAQVEHTPDAVALIWDDQVDCNVLTYAELNAQANQLAHYLRQAGVTTETPVGVCLNRNVDLIISFLAIIKAGGAYVPLDPTYPIDRLQFMVQDTGLTLILTETEWIKNLPTDAQLINVHTLDRQSYPQTCPHGHCTTDNLLYIMYTSGSTGQPKGIEILHRNVQRLVKGSNFAQLDATQTFLHLASPSFDAATLEVWGSLCNGAKLVLYPDTVVDLHQVGQFIQRYRVTTLWLTAGLFHQMVDGNPAGLKGVRQLLAGGDVLSVRHIGRLLASSEADLTLINGYGPTENTTFTTTYRVTDPTLLTGSVPIGVPISHTQVYILDQTLQPMPVGVQGELYTGGLGLARGYLNRPELTAERFIDHPQFGRLYKTGDLCRWLLDRNGTANIEFIGRTDFQVKIRGFRIELGEIEAILNRQPNVGEVVVVAREEPSGKRLVAYLTFVDDRAGDVQALHTALNETLPNYMIPSAFVVLETMPLTPNGKVDRQALPAPETMTVEKQLAPPRTPTEEIVAAIWQEVLGLERVSIHDDFFALGGHSLMATQVVSRIRQSLQLELPLRHLWTHPTVAELAAQLTRETGHILPPLKPAALTDHLPLSFAQQRLWFLAQLQAMNDVYNVPIAFRLTGPLDIVTFEASWQRICERHAVLRTTFPEIDGQAYQQINPADIKVELIDLSDLALTQQKQAVVRLSQNATMQPFDLGAGPLWRVSLLRLGPEEHELHLTMHHIISDGWSIGLLLRELSTLYAQQPDRLSDLPVQYADFALWQRAYLTGDFLQKQLDYWRAQLADAPPLLTLPTDHPRPAVQGYEGDRFADAFSESLSWDIKQLSQQQSATLFMTLQAAFAILMSRYSGQDDILLGSPIANREVAEVEDLIGFFVNTVVLRTDLSAQTDDGPRPTFREVLDRVRQTALDAYQHQAVPFERLVETLQPERSLSHSPFFQVMFTQESRYQEALVLPNITITPLAVDYPRAKFDLILTMQDHGHYLVAWWEYNTDLFERATIERMATHFQTLLEGIVANPEQAIVDLPLVTEAERHQLLVAWNDTATPYPKEKSIQQLFEVQVERSPDAIALVFGEKQMTYHELNERANQLAHYLIAQGVGPDILVGICVERSVEMVVGLLAILKAGGAYVPLDTDYPQERIAFMLEDAQAAILLTEQQFVERLSNQAVQLFCLDRDWETITTEKTTNPANRVGPENVAYVIYTSGSTGCPKGVVVPHRGINRLVNNTNYIDIIADDRMAQASNASFDAATFEIWGALLHGACLVGISHEDAISPQRLAVELQRQKISILFLTTALFNQVVSFAPEAFRNLRYLLFGGEAVDPAAVRKLLADEPPEHFLHVYGPTECTTYSTWYPIHHVAENATTVPIGISLANSQMYVLDEQLAPLPVGVSGELYLGGDGVALGYLNQPELTAERFIPNPFGSKDNPDKLYKTGDNVRYLPEGNIEFLGRVDFQVKIRGFRIELGEIETHLRQCAGVHEVVVLVREDGAGKRIVAYITFNEDASGDARTLRASLSETLPHYMVPAAFVILEKMPLTPNGKIDRKALPDPDYTDVMDEAAAFVPPETETEMMVAAVWSEILGIEQMSIQADFFDLGGHSLLATQVISRLNNQFQIQLSVRSLFENPTIATLSKRIQAMSIAQQMTLEARQMVDDQIHDSEVAEAEREVEEW